MILLHLVLADLYEEKVPVASIVPLLPTSHHHIQPVVFPSFTGHIPPSMGGVPDCMRDSPVETKQANLADIKEKTPLTNLKVCNSVVAPGC